MKKFVLTMCSLGFLATAQAQVAAVEQGYDQVQQLFGQLNLQVNAISDAPIDGLVQVFTNRGLFFASKDGQYFVEGKIYDIQKRELLNDSQMRPYIQKLMAQSQNDVIEYKAKNEKYVVNVFTDPSCGYCRKLHNEMQGYNDAGITVRYLAFPRGGLGSETSLQMQHIWCSKDSQAALTAAKDGDAVEPVMCNNPVKKQYEMGQSFGISGTPAIILPNGRLIPGYQPPKQLLAQLESGS